MYRCALKQVVFDCVAISEQISFESIYYLPSPRTRQAVEKSPSYYCFGSHIILKLFLGFVPSSEDRESV